MCVCVFAVRRESKSSMLDLLTGFLRLHPACSAMEGVVLALFTQRKESKPGKINLGLMQ